MWEKDWVVRWVVEGWVFLQTPLLEFELARGEELLMGLVEMVELLLMGLVEFLLMGLVEMVQKRLLEVARG